MSDTITAINVAKAVKKQMEYGFTDPAEIKNNLAQEGFTPEEVDAYLSGKSFQQGQGAGKYIFIGIGLIVVGLILMATAGEVFGALRFSLNTQGDVRRWKELVLQPFAGLSVIILGIIAIIRRRPIPLPGLAIPFIILFVALALADLITNRLGMLFYCVVVVTLVVLLTRKPTA